MTVSYIDRCEVYKSENTYNGILYLTERPLDASARLLLGVIILAMSWTDTVNLREKFITVNKSMFYNTELKQWELGKPKGGISRTVDFGNSLADILKQAKKAQQENRMFLGKD